MTETAFVIQTTVDDKNRYWQGDYWVSNLNKAKLYETKLSTQKIVDSLFRKADIKRVSITLSKEET